MHYVCAHCNVTLGTVIVGNPEPQCVDHPSGVVYAVADPETDLA